MSKNLISIGYKFRNKGATIVPKEGLEDVDKCMFIFSKLDKWLKLNKMNFTPSQICPLYEHRLLERPKPSYARNIIKREKFRKRDRDIIKGFCNYIIYRDRMHKPS